MDAQIVDVIVLNWNGSEVIIPCLESLADSIGPALRITVVDNGSTDSSVEMVRELFPEVEVILNGENLLFAEGNNAGIRRAIEKGGELFLLLNNDTEVGSSAVAEMKDALGNEGVGIVGPKIYYYDDPATVWYGGGGFYPGVWIPRHKNIRKKEGSFTDKAGPTDWVTGCAILFTKKVVDDIGLLDPSYRIYCEDVDFCLRARKAGWTCWYQPTAKIWHKVSSSSGGGMTPFNLENRISSTSRLFSRFRPAWWRILFIPLHLAGFVCLLAVLAISGKWGLVLASFRGGSRAVRGN